jgi:hypothetical protein
LLAEFNGCPKQRVTIILAAVSESIEDERLTTIEKRDPQMAVKSRCSWLKAG